MAERLLVTIACWYVGKLQACQLWQMLEAVQDPGGIMIRDAGVVCLKRELLQGCQAADVLALINSMPPYVADIQACELSQQ
jgi:hypothetical protein